MNRVSTTLAAWTMAAGIIGLAAAQPAAKDPATPAPPPSVEPPAVNLAEEPTLYVVGYAHLDTQWRWTYADTIREYIPATLNDNFKLFEKYPNYVFNFSGSRRYRMMQEYYPAEYEKLKGYVASGKWYPCGSSVDENDANVPSAESFVRQVLYGNKYFRSEFGVASDEFMLPDCFGFPAALPSLLSHCGLKGFSTQKLTWGLAIPQIPFKVGVWTGPDGRGVIAALDPGAYVGEVQENLANSNGWQQRIQNNGKQSGVFTDYHYYGTGDTGGAPRDRSVAMVEESVKTKGPIKVISGPADWMFKAITPEMRERLPRYSGELMLTEHSAGSISSQAYMKRWNRKNELLADAAERAALAAVCTNENAVYPAEKLEDAWYLVLGSQMHDILPGTSVPKAYDFSWNDEVLAANQFESVLGDAAAAVIAGLDTRVKGTCIVVYNPLSAEREDIVEAEIPVTIANPKGVKVTGPDATQVAAQILDVTSGTARIAFVAKAPSVGFAAFDAEVTESAPPAMASALRVAERQLENESYIVKIDDHGDVSSVFDKQAKRELLSAPARLSLHYENPRQWPAWNQDWADRQKPARGFAGAEGPVTFKIVENGPARVAVEVTRGAEGSTFIQRIRLAAGGAGTRVEFDTRIDWRTRERSLRAAFPLTVSNPIATFDVQQGAIERPNSHEKHFEYSFHKWLDLTDTKGDYGATVMCDSKYACDKPDDRTLRLTLLHTPGTRGGYPDQGTQDLGRHEVVFALSGHKGSWRDGLSYAQADRLNQPLIPFRAPAHDGRLGKEFSFLRVSNPAVSISAAKAAEAGSGEMVVRLREQTGEASKSVRIAASKPIISAREVDGQEREIGKTTVVNGELVVDVGAFELRAFALDLGVVPAKAGRDAGTSTPLVLPFDTDVISTNANRADGAMDDQGRSLPAEQLQASIRAGRVAFNLGPTADGQKNAVACRGQEINLPQGNFDRIYLLAAATGDVDTAIEVDGKATPWSVQNWTGYIGQWDRRVWPGETSESGNPRGSEIAGLDPGFIKSDDVAWYCSHHHTLKGDTLYEYCYLFNYPIEAPAGARVLKLPNEPRVKVLAISVGKAGTEVAVAARPMFDTFDGHAQDAPRIVPDKGQFTDATNVLVQPTLYWRDGAVRYTTDGSEPTARSPVYTGPLTINATTTIKAAVLGRDGAMGPSIAATLEVNDATPPTITKVSSAYKSASVRVGFSEPVDAGAAAGQNFAFDPAIEVKSATRAEDGRSVLLQLAAAPEMDRSYRLSITGVKDASPAANTMKPAVLDFKVSGPVYRLPDAKEQLGKEVRGVPGLPVKGNDTWTMNMFVRTASQPANRTIIAGFGKCAPTGEGAARYMAKFANGIHFWSHNRDVACRTPLELNRWQMLTATYDGRVLRVYKDAKKIGEREVQLSDDENVVNFAPPDPWESRRRFEGNIREFTIWNDAMDDEAVASLREGSPQP